jgi:hypothetical protein
MRILSFLARQCDLLRESDNKLLLSQHDGAALQGQESTRSPDPARFRRADSVWVRLVRLWRSNLSTQKWLFVCLDPRGPSKAASVRTGAYYDFGFSFVNNCVSSTAGGAQICSQQRRRLTREHHYSSELRGMNCAGYREGIQFATNWKYPY